jgi:hypothetical protein
LNNVRQEARTHFRNKKRVINGLVMSSKSKNIRDLYRGINEFKTSYEKKNNNSNNFSDR